MLALALLACSSTPTDTDAVPTGDTDLPTPDPTADTAAPTPTADTAEPPMVVDCNALPTSNFPSESIPGASSYHGITFDGLGNLFGSDGTSLIKASAPGMSELFLPNVGLGEQMDMLPDGDIAWSQDPEVVRITPQGGRTVLVDNVNAYGLVVGPDGYIYTANQNAVERIDPNTGARSPYTTGVGSPKVINWSPDYTRFYVGTNFSSGDIYVYDIDPVTYQPLSGPTLFAQTPNTWHDTMGVDICGNLYVAEFWDRSLWRFTPDGERSLIVDFNAINQTAWYAHSLEWGSGIGDWDPLSIYVGQPYNGNTVRRVQVGVPSREYTGPVEVIPFAP